MEQFSMGQFIIYILTSTTIGTGIGGGIFKLVRDWIRAQEAEREAERQRDREEREQFREMMTMLGEAIKRSDETVRSVNESKDTAIREMTERHAVAIDRLAATVDRMNEIRIQEIEARQKRDEQTNDALIHLSTTLAKVDESMQAQSANIRAMMDAISDHSNTINIMQDTVSASFERMEQNVLKTIDRLAQDVGGLLSSINNGNEQHVAIMNQLSGIKKAIIDLIPPEPKPPKVQPMPKQKEEPEEDKQENEAA